MQVHEARRDYWASELQAPHPELTVTFADQWGSEMERLMCQLYTTELCSKMTKEAWMRTLDKVEVTSADRSSNPSGYIFSDRVRTMEHLQENWRFSHLLTLKNLNMNFFDSEAT